MLLHAGYLLVLRKVCCRGPFLLHVPGDQPLQARHSNNESFSMALHMCNLDYCEKHFNSSQDALPAFKAARFFSPHKMNDIHPNADAINALTFQIQKKFSIFLKKSFLPILLKCQTLIQALTIFSGGRRMNQLYHAGQQLPVRFYLCSLHLQHQKEYFHY